jgi:hypothetical protein
MAVAFPEADLLERAVEIETGLDAPRTHERRLYQRLRDRDLRWVRHVRLGAGRGVTLVDLSAGGALIDSPIPLRPASILTLQIAGAGVDTAVEFRVLRCQVGAIGHGGPTYRAACEFTRLIELPNARHVVPLEIPAANPLAGFVGLDLALKQLVDRAVPTAVHALDPECMLHALRALHNRALKQPLDPIGSPLADLLSHVLPALETETALPTVLRRIEQQLRLTVPQATLRLTSAHSTPPAGVRSTFIKIPGAPESQALVSIDIPRGVVLNDWQSRVVRITGRVITLLQCFDAGGEAMPSADESSGEEMLPQELGTADGIEGPPSTSGTQAAWQKIVVRYAEGQILKGYSHDFSATRSQFSLWPSTAADANDRVIVPLARLKAVFFVRDFAGNPGYVERTETDAVQHGRRIEVTLVDDEVITGRTLSYRPDGHGFFVVPADPNTNNIRVFVVSSSVRQVRFP